MKAQLKAKSGSLGGRRWAHAPGWLVAFAFLPACDAVPGAAETGPPEAPAAIAGDVIAKFRDDSEAGRMLASILAGKQSIDAAAPLAQRLSKDVGVPLAPVRVTSGRELLLAIDREQLGQMFRQRAERVPGVVRIAPAPSTRSVLPASRVEYTVEVEGAQAQTARDVARGDQSPNVEKLVTGLAGDLRPHTTLRSGDGDSLLLSVDVVRLTQAVVAHIQRQPDVEYVQANTLLKPYN